MKTIWNKIKNMFMEYQYMLIILGIFIGVYSLSLSDDLNVQNVHSIFTIPISIFWMKYIIETIEKNRDADIDVYLLRKVERKIIWKINGNNSGKNNTYIVIKNTGNCSFECIYIKIKFCLDQVEMGYIPEKLKSGKKCIVYMPINKKHIEEIIVTGGLKISSETKKFNGEQLCKKKGDQKIVFSNIEYMSEKAAVDHEGKAIKKLQRVVS